VGPQGASWEAFRAKKKRIKLVTSEMWLAEWIFACEPVPSLNSPLARDIDQAEKRSIEEEEGNRQ